MNYTLNLSLEGFEKGGEKISGIKKEIQSIATASAQGGLKINDFSKFFDGLSDSVRKLNPELAKAVQAAKNIGPSIQGLKEPSYGKELGKIHAMGEIPAYHGPTPPKLPPGPPKEDAGFPFLSNFIKGFAIGSLIMTSIKKIVKEIAEQIKQTFEDARRLYAKALTSGMGVEFTLRRSMIADIIGVSEKDVFRFGAQMAYLNPRLEQAVKSLTETNLPLTQVSWNFKILQADLSALFSKIAADAAPAILKFVDALDALINWFNKNTPAITGALAGAFPGLKLAGIISSRIGQKEQPISSPQAWMKQFGASSLERIGLVTMGSGQNHMKDIAKNTKDATILLKEILANNKGRNQNSSFGMSMFTSQP